MQRAFCSRRPQAFPYYASVFTTMAGFFVVCFFFLYHK